MGDFSQKEWYLWPCTACKGEYNMAVDHFLAQQTGLLLNRPVLRFFTWKPYCISLGYHQNINEIDREKCRAGNVDVVRRPTGGRAIFHAQELTYSVIYPYGEMEISGFYRLVHLPMVRAIQEMGIAAEFVKTKPNLRQFYKTDKSAACFASSAQYEVAIDGRKLIGSAQRVYEKAILQHGSLLLGAEHEQLGDFLNVPEPVRLRLKNYVREHTAHLQQYQSNITPMDLATRIQHRFEELFSIHFSNLLENDVLYSAINKLDTATFTLTEKNYSQ